MMEETVSLMGRMMFEDGFDFMYEQGAYFEEYTRG
jgi:hypothetical protein